MTDEQINEAITQATGLWDYPYSSETKRMYDFCSDLNAMHEAENCLSLDDRNHYIDALGTIHTDSWEFATATARQRAEAFLRTLGKWEEVQQ